MIIRALLVVFSVILIQPVWAGERVITPEPFNRYNESFIKNDTRGNIFVAYYDMKWGIHIKNVTEGIEHVVNEGRERFSKGLAFDIQGEHIFIVWREKIQGIKKLWFRASHDGGKTLSGPVLLDDNTTEALTRIKIGSNQKGDVFIIWLGEKKTGDSKHHIYGVFSNDFGKTFSGPKNLTSGYRASIYPILLVDDNGACLFSYSRKPDDRKYMVFRRTTDGGRTWTEPAEIKEVGTISGSIEPFKIGKRLHVVWLNSYNGIEVVESAYSDDNGKTWITTTLEDTRGYEVAHLKVAHDGKNHIYTALAARKDENEKFSLLMIRSKDNGNTWEKHVPLRHYPFKTTRVSHPEIDASENGEVVVIWVDYRNIRSNLYMQFSRDYGTTWQEKDIPLEEPGRFNTSHFPYTDTLTKIKDHYYLLAFRFKKEIFLEEADLLLLDFTIDGRGAL